MAYYLPAEWHPQSGIMLTWPHAKSYWDPILEETQVLYARLIKAIAVNETVLLVCENSIRVSHFLQEHGVDVMHV